MKLSTLRIPFALAAILALGACATAPSGPSVMVLPGDGKSFDQFRFDDQECRAYAQSQSGGSVAGANDAGVKSAAVATLIGAAAGAAFDGKDGAAAGAGAGLLLGSLAGAGQASSGGLQRRYDNGYIQCMYAKGHKVPSVTSSTRRTTTTYSAAAPAAVSQPTSANVPPPPAGMPPPPPPGVGQPR